MRLMLFHKQLEFASGAVLTKEMLELLGSYPRQFLKLYFKAYSEGILCGLDYELRGDDLWLTSGAFWWHNELWMTGEDVNVSAFLQNQSLQEGQYLVLCWQEDKNVTEKGVDICPLKLSIDTDSRYEGVLELGRFIWWDDRKLQLPQSWEELIESLERGDYFDISNASQAALRGSNASQDVLGGGTFIRLIFRCLKEALRKKERRTSFEDAMLVQLQSQGFLSMDTLYTYVGTEAGRMNRRELLKAVDEELRRQPAPVVQAAAPKENPDHEDRPDEPRWPMGGMLD
ncbi:hypothetical protein [Megasphaera massiliensis]|uniref:hypothetical protein n=2 Tax=Megasphaera massiliensis TaxID=1232428 RepID=UPI00266DC09F|nr:hypothetical protein [Megasphaera massiliensis]